MEVGAELQQAIGAFAAVVGAAASVMGIALAIDQLTSGARLRALEATLRAAQTSDGGPHDPVLRSVQVATLGRILARQAVPARTFASPAFLIGIAWSQALVAASTFDPAGDRATLVVSAVLGVVLGGSTLTEIVYLVGERGRIRRCFQAGVQPIRAHTDRAARFAAAFRRPAGTCYVISACAVASLMAGAIVLTGDDSWKLPAVAVAGAGGATLARLIGVVQEHLARGDTAEPQVPLDASYPTWVHPDPSTAPTTQQASAPHEVTPAGQTTTRPRWARRRPKS